MPGTCCCVPLCSNTGGHQFPTDKTMRKKWLVAIRRAKWVPTKSSVVCRKHFSSDQYLEKNYYGNPSLKRQLKSNAVPCIFAWTLVPSTETVTRQERVKKREELKAGLGVAEHLPPNDFALELTVANSKETVTHEDNELHEIRSLVEESTQTEILDCPMSVKRFSNDCKAMSYYTGLSNFETFQFVLQTLGPAAYKLKYYQSQVLGLSVPNQLFLTLIKLRLNRSYFELSRMFDVSETTATNIFITWINFMYLQWRELKIWSDKFLVDAYMPSDFKSKFPSTRVIIDSLECKINRPKNPVSQQATWSTYKNDNTMKAVVGCTPGGLVSFCTHSYGGSTSDRQIIERSDLRSLCDPGDSVMADRGFNIEDLLITNDVTVNMPHFVKGKSQLKSLHVLQDRKVSSKRIHVERIIGMARTYKILKQHMTRAVTKLSSEIIFICFMLCNFRPCIVSRDA